MTGLERLIQKVSNATAQAMMGNRPAVATVEAWSLDELRRAALEDERHLEQMAHTRRRMVQTLLD